MTWKVPYGFYKKNMVKIYLLFFILLCLTGTAGWFVKEQFNFDENISAVLSFVCAALLLFLLTPIIFRKGISKYIADKGASPEQLSPRQ